jgi:hypothetical protein
MQAEWRVPDEHSKKCKGHGFPEKTVTSENFLTNNRLYDATPAAWSIRMAAVSTAAEAGF